MDRSLTRPLLIPCLAAAMWLSTATNAALAGEPRVVWSEATYAMADEDTLVAAEQKALLRAQQRAVEEAAVYIETIFQDSAASSGTVTTQRSSLTIHTLAASVLETQIVGRTVTVERDRPIFFVRIRAVVDRSRLEAAIQRLHREDRFAEHYRQIKTENVALKTELARLRRDVKPPRPGENMLRIESPEELVQRALRAGSWSEKIALASHAITANPREYEAFILRGQTFLHIGTLVSDRENHREDRIWVLRKAEADFSRALELRPDNTWALLGRAEVFTVQGRTENALRDYRQILAVDPLFDLARQRMTVTAVVAARAEASQRRWSTALALLDHALGQDPLPAWVSQQTDAYLLRSRILIALDRPQDALRDLGTLLEAIPTHGEALVQRGALYRRIGESALSNRDLLQACELGMRQACRG